METAFVLYGGVCPFQGIHEQMRMTEPTSITRNLTRVLSTPGTAVFGDPLVDCGGVDPARPWPPITDDPRLARRRFRNRAFIDVYQRVSFRIVSNM